MRSIHFPSAGRRPCVVELMEPRMLLSGAALLADINVDTAGSIPTQFTAFGGDTLFLTGSGNISQLWKTDGTAGGTTMLKQLVAAEPNQFPTLMPALSDVALFFAPDAEHGKELWRTDGTVAGTYLLKDINPGSASSPRPPVGSFVPPPDNALVIDDVLYFQATDGEHGLELWRSDGTVDGTYQVKDIWAGSSGSSISRQVVVDDILYFAASDGTGLSPTVTRLFRSDGTVGGTYAVTGGTFSAPRDMAAVGDDLFFFASASSGNYVLYRTDGVSAPVAISSPIRLAGGVIGETTVLGSTYFFTPADGTTGTELWASDGTLAGTRMVKDLRDGSGSTPRGLVASGGLVYFTADSGTGIGRELYVSDGTEGGTVLVEDIRPGISSALPLNTMLVAHDGAVYFPADDGVHGIELWRSGGTAGTTELVRDVMPGNDAFAITNLRAVNGALFFSGDDLEHGREPWRSDGTAAGTSFIKDLNTTQNLSSNPSNIVTIGNVAYFAATRGATGTELWRTDGTPAGTHLVKDIRPGTAGSHPTNFVEIDGIGYFIADDGSTGYELWRTDGTAAGTFLVKDVVSGPNGSTLGPLVVVGSQLFFSVAGDLWKSNGTEAGTVLVKDLTTDGVTSFLYDLTAHDGLVWFGNGWGTQQLWKSDGTDAGTVPVKPSGGPTGVDGFTSVGDTLYFTGSDPTYGRELWKTDGTAAGTVMVKDIHTTGSSNAGDVVAFNGRAYFWAFTPTYGYELWSTDGTDAGTTLVKDSNPGPAPTNGGGERMMVGGDKLYFGFRDSSNGYELWQSDGTEVGTRIVKQLNPGNVSSIVSPPRMAYANGLLYFAGIGPTGGVELYQTNGTEAGTTLTANISAGDGSSQPANLTALNDSLIFSADNGVHGVELWTLAPIGPAWLTPSAGSAYALSGDALTITGGMITLSADAGLTHPDLNITVATDAAVIISTTQHIASLQLTGTNARGILTAGGDKLLVTKHLAIADGAVLDLADNDLLWDYTGDSPYTTLRGYIVTGRDTGTSGIISTRTAANDMILAPIDNAQFGRTGWDGEFVDGTTLIGKYTYYGDSNLDGKVTGDDYVAIDSNLGLNPGSSQWFQGDFNFDDHVTGDDYVSVDANLGDGTLDPAVYDLEQAEMIAIHADRYGGKKYIRAVEEAAEGGTKSRPQKRSNAPRR